MKIDISDKLLDAVSGYLEENGNYAPETKDDWSEYIEDCIRIATDNIQE